MKILGSLFVLALTAFLAVACDDGQTTKSSDTTTMDTTSDTGADTGTVADLTAADTQADTQPNDTQATDTVPDTTPGCDGLAEGKTRCAGKDIEVCQLGEITVRECARGKACLAPDPSCECDNLADAFCPAMCAGDPDCASCTPQCSGKNCGSDTCGGTCGAGCSASQLCQDGTCIDPVGVCSDTCGPAGSPGEWANDGACDDGGDGAEQYCDYGTDCGDCGAREPLPLNCLVGYNDDCDPQQRCDCDVNTGNCACADGIRGTGALGSACTAQHDCASALCVNDKCSQPCASGADCSTALPVCQSILGMCVEGTCTAECGTALCGDDGCGGSCGSCGANEVCSAGQCVAGGAGAIDCPYNAGSCSVGEACCVSQANQSACFPVGSVKELGCKAEADNRAYLYIGCDDHSDCPGQRCCADMYKSYCADTCQTEVCQRGVPTSCDTGYVCCPFLSTTGYFTSDPRNEGRCFPINCPS